MLPSTTSGTISRLGGLGSRSHISTIFQKNIILLEIIFMKSKKIFVTSSSLLGILIYILITSSSGGVTGKSSTGCGGGTCHAQNAATIITLTGIPVTGYTAGNTYTVTVNVQNTSKVSAGFNLMVSDGIISNASVGTNISSANHELAHTTPKPLLAAGASWTFNWTAPSAGGAIIIDVAGNAVNATGSSSGDAYSLASFNYNSVITTSAPTIVSQNVNTIGINSAKVNAMVNANNASTTVSVEYGLSNAYGSMMFTSPSSVNGNAPSAVSTTLNSLLPNTLYHYQVRAINSVDTTFGPDSTFTTLATKLNDISETDFKIYPNPCESSLYFSTGINISYIQFEAIDFLGHQFQIPNKMTKQGEYQLSLNALAFGNYILQINADKKTYRYLFTKSR